MPFVEIKPRAKSWVRIGDDRIIVSFDLRTKHLKDTRVRVFYDAENELVGLKPSIDGYKITKKGRIWCSKLGVPNGYYAAQWSNEHAMLVVILIPTLLCRNLFIFRVVTKGRET